MKINETSEQGRINEILNIEKAVILYFYNDHCAPCLSLRPKLEALIESNFPNFYFIYITNIYSLGI